LEDLQRRAGSPDDNEADNKDAAAAAAAAGTTPKNAANKVTKSPPKKLSKPASQKLHQPMSSSKPLSHRHHQQQYTPPMESQDLMFCGDRSRSHTPPMFGYGSYPPAADDFMMNPYSAPPSAGPHYSTMTTTTTAEPYPGYLSATAPAPSPPLPVTMPSMSHFNDAVKRDVYVADDSPMAHSNNPYMSYGYVPGMDIGIPSPYESNPQVSHHHHHHHSAHHHLAEQRTAGHDTLPPLLQSPRVSC
jgi:hypothetical protein